MKKPVKTYMTALPQTIGENATLKKARDLMEETGCHHLPVLDGGTLVGILSYNDISLHVLSQHTLDSKVGEVMTSSTYEVDPETPVNQVAQAMLEQKLSSAIIKAKAENPWGIFTTTDALKVIAQ